MSRPSRVNLPGWFAYEMPLSKKDEEQEEESFLAIRYFGELGDKEIKGLDLALLLLLFVIFLSASCVSFLTTRTDEFSLYYSISTRTVSYQKIAVASATSGRQSVRIHDKSTVISIGVPALLRPRFLLSPLESHWIGHSVLGGDSIGRHQRLGPSGIELFSIAQGWLYRLALDHISLH
ncbi:hypothetical protein RRG08_036307 [Elysia crispata]|uniref:Uncharacterized protein n=1 Tax=Elysia crispata TaxID=231223 RepID=A0AAE0ZP00_9GAST|nr:hypothetical protein RRG08_036307 [Elysia crispata]